MKLKVIACEVFFREVCHLAAESPHSCDPLFLPKGLHDLGVEKMLPRLQKEIDAVPAATYDAVVLAYGLCNNGVAGLTARNTKLVMPRAHDCITIFLGSRGGYEKCFAEHPGTYYRTTGWLERNDAEGAGDETVQQRLGLAMKYDELVQQYGEENAAYIMETMGDLTAHYDRLAFIRMGLGCEDRFCRMAREEAEQKGWAFEEIEGSMTLLRKLLQGDWDDDILIVEPGQSIRPTYNDDVIRAE